MLVTYDENYTVINSQMLAYDEIADGLLHAKSTVFKDKIVLEEYVSESMTTITFNILGDGNITRE